MSVGDVGPFVFPARVARHGDSHMHYDPVPEEVVLALRDAGVRRVVGELDGHPFERALHVDAAERGSLRFGIGWLRDARIILGQKVTVFLRPDDPNRVEVPAELAAALEKTPQSLELWQALTPGRRRSLAYSVERGKRPETRLRRSERIVDDLLLEAGLDPDPT